MSGFYNFVLTVPAIFYTFYDRVKIKHVKIITLYEFRCMQDLDIPNGYFHLWQLYVSEQGVDVLNTDFLHNERDALQRILNLPIDAQSPYLFFIN